MKQNKALKLAYAAGFIDGEGFIGIVKENRSTPRGKSESYAMRVVVGQQDGEIMDWLVGNFGGSVHHVKRDGSYMWYLTNRKAYDFLKRIEPFLKYKRPQAKLAIAFHERCLVGNEKRRYKALSESELARREHIYQQLRNLKKAFSSPKMFNRAVVETK